MFEFNIKDFTGKQKEDALSERQIQLENWSQFNRSMRLWQAEHPDATEGDYYIESRRKLPFYRGRTDDEIQSGTLPIEGEATEKELTATEKRYQEYLELKARNNQ